MRTILTAFVRTFVRLVLLLAVLLGASWIAVALVQAPVVLTDRGPFRDLKIVSFVYSAIIGAAFLAASVLGLIYGWRRLRRRP
jgi:hypothetical protein